MPLDRLSLLAGFIALAGTLSALHGQTGPPASDTMPPGGADRSIPLIEVSLGYSYLRANAPPGACQCFSLIGGYGSITANFPHGLSLVADMSAAHANHIVGGSQSLTVVNFLYGPRYTWRPASGRLTPFGQVLLGSSTQDSNASAIPNATAFAFTAGGGVSTKVNRRLGLNLIQVDWLHSDLPNGVNNRQNDLRIDSGVIVRF
jgi:hypothetical protein